MFRNNASFYGEELLAPRPNPKLKDHPLSAVGHSLFIRNLRTRHAVVTGTQNYNFACYFVWMRNLAANIEKGTWAKGA
jgi:hypothetical protein